MVLPCVEMILLNLTCGIAAFLFYLSYLAIGEYQVTFMDFYLTFYIQFYKKKGQMHNQGAKMHE